MPEPAARRPRPRPSAPGIVAELDYESLTLAQLRARLPSLRVADLEALLAYEEAHQGARAVPDAAGQQDHPRDRQVTAPAGRAHDRRRAGQVPRQPLAGARRRHAGRQVRIDRLGTVWVEGQIARAEPAASRPRASCCATRPPTCRCR